MEGPTGVLHGGGPLTLIPRGVNGSVLATMTIVARGFGAEVSVANGLRQVQAVGDDVVTVEAEAHRGDIG
jgi:hypothetical protein